MTASLTDFVPAPARLPAGRRVYAIGDIHGCLAQLNALHEAIAADLAARPAAAPLLVHIGDYVDRGPDSAGVIERLRHGPPIAGVPTVNLKGNHEQTMMEALAGERAAGTDWLFHGGKLALASYGIDPDGPREAWKTAVPETHLAFLQGLTMMHREGGYLFVHAGIRPGVPLEEQAPEDLLRIRQPFLFTEQALGVVVVHGHTPVKTPVVRRNRIGIDTGAVFGGDLTCIVLEGATLRFLTA
ncbi:MAG TPA: metallophosphoesterase family protein [Acetobacteraceae bacterium]|jgi:serine/threonine protein phosphatase 1|nr:metallophosphoesterase family protein [Acetobacteraceae bacterium]